MPDSIFSSFAALIGMVAATLGLAATGFIFFRVRRDVEEIALIKSELEYLKKEVSDRRNISNELENITEDFYRIISLVRANLEVIHMGGSTSDESFSEMYRWFNRLEKNYLELGMFSENKSRRVECYRSLALMYGDLDTLQSMLEIRRGGMGMSDPEISDAIRTLHGRLQELVERVDATWTGSQSM